VETSACSSLSASDWKVEGRRQKAEEAVVRSPWCVAQAGAKRCKARSKMMEGKMIFHFEML
jgi:hypothetical protein